MLQIDTDHLDTHLVTVQNVLHQRAHTGGNLVALFGERGVHFHFANHFANRRFSRLHHGFAGVFAFEQVGACIAQAVLHGKLDIDDVFIGGQHGRLAQAGGLEHVVAANVHRTDLCGGYRLMALYRIGQAPVETGTHRGLVTTKLRNHRLLALLHDEEAGSQPDHEHDGRDHPGAQTRVFHIRRAHGTAAIARPLRPAWAATEQAIDFFIEVAP